VNPYSSITTRNWVKTANGMVTTIKFKKGKMFEMTNEITPASS